MQALVLESKHTLTIRDFPIEETMGPHDVKVAVKACGICGSDIHYYKEGAIGDFVVKQPMVLGHEAAGIITEKGENVTNLKIGDRVCLEPGVPNMNSTQVLEGNYHLDPEIYSGRHRYSWFVCARVSCILHGLLQVTCAYVNAGRCHDGTIGHWNRGCQKVWNQTRGTLHSLLAQAL
jgi:threonine dehydrogenase-like Zn-dependent dehydrogenase